MRLFRTHRRLTALLALGALFLAQASAIAYACPLDAAPARMAADPPCHDAGDAPAAQCTAHCQAGAQSVDQAKPLAAAAAVGPLLAVVALVPAGPRPNAVRTEPVPARAAAPPLAILYHRFLN
jgi:hypothetical protein